MLSGKITAVLLAAAAVANAQAQILVPKNIPYSDNSRIPEKVVKECAQLGEHFSNSIVTYGKEMGLDIAATDKTAAEAQGDFADVRMDSALSFGNAFIGHAKGVSASVQLLRNGQAQTDKHTLSRHSMGGIFGGFKSSCSVLDRTVDTLGKDVAAWLSEQQKSLPEQTETDVQNP